MTGGKTKLAGFPRDLTLRAQSIQPEFRESLVQNLNGLVQSNRKSFEKTGLPFEVDHFSWSDWSEFWLNGSRPKCSSAILISRLLLCMHHMYVDSVRWDFH